MDDARKVNLEDVGKLVLRIVLGGLLLFHGVSKIVHGVGMIESRLVALNYPSFVAYGVYIGEVVAPLFVIFGFWTRFSALVIAFDLVVAVLLVRMPDFFTLTKSGGGLWSWTASFS